MNTKIKVKTAKAQLNRFTFEFGHGTTNKFFEPTVPLCMEVVKGSKIKLQMSNLRRIDPMPLPPMSMVRFTTRFFYVPYIDICPYYEHLISQTPYQFRYGDSKTDCSSRIPLKVPTVETAIIKSLLFQNFVADLTTGTNILNQTVSIGVVNLNEYVANHLGNYETLANDYLQLVPIVTTSDADHNIGDPTGAYDIQLTVICVNNNIEYKQQCYFKYTERGRIFFKLLKQLGYDFNINAKDIILNDGYNQELALSQSNVEFSALKLLAFTKVYLDHYESSQFINNTTRLKQLGSLCHIDNDEYSLTESDLDLICDLACYMAHENDYFTTQFVNPANGNNFVGNNEYIQANDITAENDSQVISDDTYYGTPYLQPTNEGVITQNGLNLLKRLQSYLKKMQVAGGRFVDRILAEYGISVKDSYSRRTSYIDAITSVLNITPVVNTTSEQLGDYAGFGSSSVDKNNVITINVPDVDGVIIAIDTITPEIYYTQGYLRENRHITKFDFLTPDFDAVGVQATEQGEILNLKENLNLLDYKPAEQTFGYKPRYAEMKEKYSYLTGDFLCDSVNTDIDSFFTDRRINALKHYNLNNGKVNITQSREFVSTYDKGQYSRIFYANIQHTDYIKTIYRFNIEMFAPMETLYEEYRLGDDNKGSEEVAMNVGGKTLT